MKIEIKLADLADIMDVVEHHIRHKNEAGYNGKPVHPFLADRPTDKEEIRNRMLVDLSKDLHEEGWQRIFIIEADGKLLGSLSLKNIFYGSLHRAELGMGIEVPLRAQGYGKKLLQAAITWAKDQNSLTWIDLSVFAHNLPARKLYANSGFKEIATIEDRLLIDGLTIDDVIMTLKLK